jgi:hypothetical protein
LESYLEKHARWKRVEQSNAAATLRKVKSGLVALGFSQESKGRYCISVDGEIGHLGISKLSRLNQFRLLARLGEDRENLLVSDAYEYRREQSGRKFSFAVSRFKDNSDECAEQIRLFAAEVVLPWLRKRKQADATPNISLDRTREG